MNNTRLEAARILEILNGSKITPEEEEAFLAYVSAGNEISEYELELLMKIASGRVAASSGATVLTMNEEENTMDNSRPILTQHEIDLLLNLNVTNKVKENTTMNVVDTAINNELEKVENEIKVDNKKLRLLYTTNPEMFEALTDDETTAITAKLRNKTLEIESISPALKAIFDACKTEVEILTPKEKLAAQIKKDNEKAAKGPITVEKVVETTVKGTGKVVENSVRVGKLVVKETVTGFWKGLGKEKPVENTTPVSKIKIK
jgi:hypothetical protein